MKNNWISIKEKLPEKEGLYLVICKPDHAKWVSYAILNFIKLSENRYGYEWDNSRFSCVELKNYQVTHWAEFEKYSEKSC